MSSLSKFIGAMLCTLFCLSSVAFAADPVEPLEQAMKFASEQKFQQALDVLEAQDPTLQSTYEHRFANARILSWSGKHNVARKKLSALLRDFPDNTDVEIATGLLEYYAGRNDRADQYFNSVLAQHPGHSEALAGLERTQKARAARSTSTDAKWRIDGAASISSFDNGSFDNWNHQLLRAEYRTMSLAVHGSINQYKRFGLSDTQLETGVSSRPGKKWDWGLYGGVTPDSEFRPKTHIGGRLGHTFKSENGPTIRAAVNYRADQYEAGTIHNVSPELTAYLKNGVVLTARGIGTLQSKEDSQFGGLVEARIPVADRWQFRLGGAIAPEAVNGDVVTTDSIFGGVTFAASDKVDIHLNISRDDREDTYVRNTANVGFTLKY